MSQCLYKRLQAICFFVLFILTFRKSNGDNLLPSKSFHSFQKELQFQIAILIFFEIRGGQFFWFAGRFLTFFGPTFEKLRIENDIQIFNISWLSKKFISRARQGGLSGSYLARRPHFAHPCSRYWPK
jgi:hypothetical protein